MNVKELFESGKFEEVIQQLSASKNLSAADRYNLGNAYARLGKPHLALAQYKLAETSATGSGKADIAANLKLVTQQANERGLILVDPSWRTRELPVLMKSVPSWGLPALLLLIFGISFYLLKKERPEDRAKRFLLWKRPRFILVFVAWLLLGGAFAYLWEAQHQPLAIVVAEQTVMRSGPKESYVELLKLPAGTTLQLEESDESHDPNWTMVRFSLGNVGWLMEKDIEYIR